MIKDLIVQMVAQEETSNTKTSVNVKAVLMIIFFSPIISQLFKILFESSAYLIFLSDFSLILYLITRILIRKSNKK